ncbi:MAG TPA: type VI secretion system Vgr family protein [Herbaspirillum sp.]
MANLLNQLLQFSSATRLYDITLAGADGLSVEAFAAVESLHAISVRDVIVLSLDAAIELKSLIGGAATLHITLADGSRTAFGGLVSEAAMLGSEGGFARYRVRIVPWLWLLSQSRTSRVWQDKTVVEIVESVFADYSEYAAWKWSDEVEAFMADARPRSYTAQYRESDLDFVTRLLAEEGIGYVIAQADDAPGAQVLLFADTTLPATFPEDASSKSALGGAGIRFHGASSRQEQDAIQTLAAKRTLQPASVTLLSYDYKNKAAVTASVPTNHAFGGKQAPRLESYDTPGVYAYGDNAEANRYGQLHLQASEARNKLWHAGSTVRTLRPGTTFALTQGPLDIGGVDADSGAAKPARYAVLSVTSVGINNLPSETQHGLAELFGPLPELLEDCIAACASAQQLAAARNTADTLSAMTAVADSAAMIEKAKALGYANSFDAIRADIAWRPVLSDGTGLRHNARPTALGSQSAIVVGPNGENTPGGADEIHCDRLGRVRIRFHWQGKHDDVGATCWVRVAQRSAGGGMGMQFLPRIGQEVLVQFLEGDIDRPVILGALYNGQGEGGVAPTPAGVPADTGAGAPAGIFEGASDQAVSGQGNPAGGNSPAWHGSSQDGAGHRNAAAQWGIRTKEFGGTGYNQLVFDDSDAQGRIQLKTTSAATELNMGHLLHAADNYRGSFRGTGSELRTDAYGAVRAGHGLLLTSYGINQDAGSRDPAGDNAPGQAMLKQAATLAKTFDQAAATHRTVGFAAHRGPSAADASALDDKAAPLAALQTAAGGMVGGDSLDQAKSDAAQKSTQAGAGKVPHFSDPVIGISAKSGLGVTAGQALQLNNGEAVALMSGRDSQFVSGDRMRVHSGQAIGFLAGSVKPGQDQAGLQAIAAQKDIDVQAQAGAIAVQSRDQLSVLSANAQIDWAAAKKITLSTAGGANITIEGGNITVQCPGKLTVHAGQKLFDGPDSMAYALPTMPTSTPQPVKFGLNMQDIPGVHGVAPESQEWKIVHVDGEAAAGNEGGAVNPAVFGADHWIEVLHSGTVPSSGELALNEQQQQDLHGKVVEMPKRIWLISGLTAMPLTAANWSTKPEQPNAKRVLDALNFTQDGRGIDPVREDYLKELAASDSRVGAFNQLKQKVDI